MANITDFTEKQFEDRLEKNVERLTKNRLAVESPTAFYLVDNQDQGKLVCDRQFPKKHKEMLLSLIMIRSNNSTQILTN